MSEGYQVKFRRTKKEKYWTIKSGMSLLGLNVLLSDMFEKSDVEELEIRVKKVKIQGVNSKL